ncbi:MAG: alpha-1,2-fucosyltransferase [Rhodobacteraceae bacterium]|nr:alpha-1,2-fucosyltransferase [Paracoccaceae bacterium]
MIVTRLEGRLGNQMFQYAAGRALALRLGVYLGLDDRYCTSHLNQFNIQVENIPQSLLPRSRFRKLLWKLRLHKLPEVKERIGGGGWKPQFEKLTDNIYLWGYWQSERFFQNCKDVIRSDFEFTTQPQGENLEIYQEIQETESCISLHVRRGDYLDPKFRSYGICSQEYYEQAIRRIAEHCDATPRVFVFSDDPEWVTDHFKLSFEMRVMTHNSADQAIEDLRLMTVCKHHVIANSSFSWWGGWLGQNTNKIVIAPSPWFDAYEKTFTSEDIYCRGWMRLEK